MSIFGVFVNLLKCGSNLRPESFRHLLGDGEIVLHRIIQVMLNRRMIAQRLNKQIRYFHNL